MVQITDQARQIFMLPKYPAQVGPTCTAQAHGFRSGIYDLWWKCFNSLLLNCLDSLIQVSWINGLIYSCLTHNRELCSMTCQEVGYSQPTQWNWQLIYLVLLSHIYDAVDSWCTQNDWHQEAKVGWIQNNQGYLIFITASHPFHLYLYDNIVQGLENNLPMLFMLKYCQPGHSTDQHPRSEPWQILASLHWL